MSEMNHQGMRIPVSQSSDLERTTFIRKTYGHLALALLAFVVVEYLFLSTPAIVSIGLAMTQGWTWLLVLGGFMFATTIAERWAHSSTNRNLQYAGLALYVVAQAFIFVPLMYMAMAITGGSTTLITQAGIITMCLFTALSAIAFFSNKDFSFLGKFLMIGGLLAMGLIVAGIAFGFNLGLYFSFAMVALAGASILYQTSQIIHQYSSDQYVGAAIGLFASFMLMLWYVLQILMSMSSSD